MDTCTVLEGLVFRVTLYLSKQLLLRVCRAKTRDPTKIDFYLRWRDQISSCTSVLYCICFMYTITSVQVPKYLGKQLLDAGQLSYYTRSDLQLYLSSGCHFTGIGITKTKNFFFPRNFVKV